MTHDPSQVADIAGRLTKAQVDGLKRAGGAGFGYSAGSLRMTAHPRSVDAAIRLGLARHGGVLTERGLLVRAHLMKGQERE